MFLFRLTLYNLQIVICQKIFASKAISFLLFLEGIFIDFRKQMKYIAIAVRWGAKAQTFITKKKYSYIAKRMQVQEIELKTHFLTCILWLS